MLGKAFRTQVDVRNLAVYDLCVTDRSQILMTFLAEHRIDLNSSIPFPKRPVHGRVRWDLSDLSDLSDPSNPSDSSELGAEGLYANSMRNVATSCASRGATISLPTTEEGSR